MAMESVRPAGAQTRSHVAWVSPSPAAESALFLDELRRGLRDFGHVEGRNLELGVYWGEGSVVQLDKRAQEAAAGRPQVIVSQGTAVFAVRKFSGTIPVVFGYSGDPVLAGLVQTMARPGGTLTGISYMNLELIGKRMQLLKETLPTARRVAVISFPQHAGDAGERRVSEVAASSLGFTLEFQGASNAAELNAAMMQLEKSRPDAVLMFPTQTVIAARERIAEWSQRNRTPVISGWAQFAEGGNFMSYGPNLRSANHRLAYFVDRILKGSRPADLPVEQPVQVELVVNLKTARAIGVTIPRTVLLRADRIIE